MLQPGIDLLEKAPDFPRDGPLLIITDGACDRLHIRREHAFLLPAGRHLPFVPKGPVLSHRLNTRTGRIAPQRNKGHEILIGLRVLCDLCGAISTASLES